MKTLVIVIASRQISQAKTCRLSRLFLGFLFAMNGDQETMILLPLCISKEILNMEMTKHCSNCEYYEGKQGHVIGECVEGIEQLPENFVEPKLVRPTHSCGRFKEIVKPNRRTKGDKVGT